LLVIKEIWFFSS